MASHKATLRRNKLKNGKESLYIHYYPPVRDSFTNKLVSIETLHLYVFQNPQDDFEKEINRFAEEKAKAILARRIESLINREHGFFDTTRFDESFLYFFAKYAQKKGDKWHSAYKHFYNFVKGQCRFKDLDINLCRKFREYLLTEAKQLNRSKQSLSHNSASGYLATFNAMLTVLYEEKYIKERLHDFIETIPWQETDKDFLTLEEAQKLAETHCNHPVLKAASMFSILTGFRISDIIQLEWEHIEQLPTGGWCVRKTTQKTKARAKNPISNEALAWCGPRSVGFVFKGLDAHTTSYHLKQWIKAAGINKHITFHCFRYTFAALQASSGTDLYTLSKMLTHRSIKTTEGYAQLFLENKVEAANRISLLKKNDNE